MCLDLEVLTDNTHITSQQHSKWYWQYIFHLLEYAEGGDLAGFIKKAKQQGKPLPEENVLTTVGQILSGLEHVKTNNNTHKYAHTHTKAHKQKREHT